MKKLDATEFKEKGGELITAIENAVGDTQRVLVQELPYVLILTQKQFDDIALMSGFNDMHESDQPYFMTKYNVMEIEVKHDER